MCHTGAINDFQEIHLLSRNNALNTGDNVEGISQHLGFQSKRIVTINNKNEVHDCECDIFLLKFCGLIN